MGGAPHTPPAEAVPLVEEMTGLTAWGACRRLADLPHLLFFDSAQSTPHGRYSFVTADPTAWLVSRGDAVFENGVRLAGVRPLEALRRRLDRHRTATVAGLPPFQGGVAGLFGYGLCHQIERLPWPRFDDFRVPDLAVGVYDWVLGFDHQTGRAWLVSSGADAGARRERLDQVKRWLDTPRPPVAYADADADEAIPVAARLRPVANLPGVFSNFSRDEYLATIRRAVEYVHAGDCFQVNIAQRLLTSAHLPALELYARLRDRNPAPFAGCFDLGEFRILSASPERFLRVERGGVETRPIKGTRPRGKTPAEDQSLADELRQSEKDRAENVMIVDLLRNDLGRVCEYGSVRVEALCRLESYPFVHHLVSEVRGTLRPECGPVDLLRAAFPGGSVTGAPKVRAMEIITELERVARGPYCGSLGYLGFDGSMDTNLLIRTFTHGRGWMQFAVGGGIVADSRPETEYDETWAKAAGLLRALVD
jgi:para-aminobenzoate synthetase component 1